MGWIFHSAKRWGLVPIIGSNHQSGMQKFMSSRPQIPQNQTATPTQTIGCSHWHLFASPCDPPKISSGSSQLASVRPWEIPPRPHGQGNKGNRPCSWNLRLQQNPEKDFETKQDLPQQAERHVLYTRREAGLGEEGYGFFLGFNELFLNFPVTTMSFRRQRHTA